MDLASFEGLEIPELRQFPPKEAESKLCAYLLAVSTRSAANQHYLVQEFEFAGSLDHRNEVRDERTH